MIYRELKIYETPLGLKKTKNVDLCERIIIGHSIFKIDLLPVIFNHIRFLTGANDLEINYRKIRGDIVTALTGDCTDDFYAAALTNMYVSSPFFEAYINYHYIMRREKIDIRDLIAPLVQCLNSACMALREAANGTYLAEDIGYLYILDAYKAALGGYEFVEIR
jgi:hypothetical protein